MSAGIGRRPATCSSGLCRAWTGGPERWITARDAGSCGRWAAVKSVDLSVSSAVKAAQLDPQRLEQNIKLSSPHELMGYNKGDLFIGGRMNINEKELAY